MRFKWYVISIPNSNSIHRLLLNSGQSGLVFLQNLESSPTGAVQKFLGSQQKASPFLVLSLR